MKTLMILFLPFFCFAQFEIPHDTIWLKNGKVIESQIVHIQEKESSLEKAHIRFYEVADFMDEKRITYDIIEEWVDYDLAYYDFPMKEDGTIHLQEVIKCPGKTKDDIYSSLKEWVAVDISDTGASIELDSKDKLIVNTSFKMVDGYLKEVVSILFTMKLDIKNERMRLAFFNFKDSGTEYKDVPVEFKLEKLFKSNGKLRKWVAEYKRWFLICTYGIKSSLVDFVISSEDDDW